MILSPAILRLKNIPYISLFLLLFFLNLCVIWLWINFLTLKYQRYLMYLGYLPMDSRRRVETPVIRPPFSGIEDKSTENDNIDLKIRNEDTSMVESFYINSPDGSRLHAHFYKFPSQGRYSFKKNSRYMKASLILPKVPTILFFHGTSGNIGHRIKFAHTLSTICQCNVMLLNCRGFGLSDGQAHSKGIREDSQAGLDYLINVRTEKDVDKEKIFVIGQSMGGAIAIDLAMRNLGRIKGMIIDNTFTRIADLVPEVLPPFSHLRNYLTEDWDSLGAIEKNFGDSRFPHCLFLIGDKDELINSSNGKALFKAAVESSKGLNGKEIRMLLFQNGYHVHTYKEPFYFDSISQFLNEVSSKKSNK